MTCGLESITRHIEILRRRFVLEYAACEVIGRAVTWAEKSAWPVVGKTRLRPRLETRTRCAAEMCAHADHHEQIAMLRTRAELVVAVGRQRHRKRPRRVRVGNELIGGAHIGEH